MFKVAALSVTLILLCVIVVAQNVNNTKSITDDAYGVTVSPNPVILGPGEIGGVIVTPDPGYYHPVITYEGETYEIGQTFSGRIFTIEPADPRTPFSFMVRASLDVTENDDETISISVEMKPEDQWDRRSVQNQSTTVTIIVDPQKYNN